MQEVSLETRPLYGIGTVARLAGIKPDTLRMWDRRYGLGASQKSESGRRQYTQTDLEHLQIIARLVASGYRIGEIASMERKTLAALLDKEGERLPQRKEEARTRITLVGVQLCQWLEEHPAVLSRLDSRLLPLSLDECFDGIEPEIMQSELLVVECPALSQNSLRQLQELRRASGARSVLVFYQFSSQAVLSGVAEMGISVDTLPVTTEKFAAGMKWLISKLEADRGSSDAGELVRAKPRIFDDGQLLSMVSKDAVLACGCNHHLSQIVRELLDFEEFTRNCAVESWQNAATHACVFTYASQARWLMEKALNAVLEEHDPAALPIQ